MSNFVHGRSQFAADLCDALGIKDARSIQIRVDVDDAVTVKIEQLVREEVGVRIIDVLRRYKMSDRPFEASTIGTSGPV